jgi:hypothetical protein
MKHLAAIVVVFGLSATPVFAAEQLRDSGAPVKLTDGELDQVVAGDPLILVSVPINVAAALNIIVEPITVKVDVPINVAAIVQANVMGNAVFDAVAVGTQNVFQAATGLRPGG